MNSKKSYNIFQNITYLIKKTIEFDKKVLGLLIIYSFMVAAVPFLTAFLSKYVIDGLVARNVSVVVGIIIVFAVIGIVSQGLEPYVKSVYEPRVMGVREKFINLLNQKVMEMDFEYTENPEVGKKLEMAMRAVSDNTSGIEGMLNSILGMFGTLISIIVYSVYIVLFKWWFFLLIAILLGAQILIQVKFKNYEISKAENMAVCSRKKNYFYYVMGDFKNGKDIRLYNLQNYLGDKYTQACDEALELQRDILSRRTICQIFETVIKIIKIIGIYLILIMSYRSGDISIGQFSFYFNAMTVCDVLALKIFKSFTDINAQSVFIDDFRDFFELKDYTNNKSDSKKIVNEIDKIEFENVSFKYSGSQNYILKDLNLTISKGERIALVGLNGAGKTTLIKLICGFYRPTSGIIKVNGVAIDDIDMKSYVGCVSALFQDYQFFSFSLRENIMAAETGDEFRFQNIVNDLDLTSVLGKLIKGFDTIIYRFLDKDGIELSGGQSQRVAFARALYKKSSLILLDEPTAALDVLAEKKLYHDFNELTKNRTVIFISHRLASTKFCDRIVTLYDGKIEESGTHEELVLRNGHYSELYRIQAEKYNMEV